MCTVDYKEDVLFTVTFPSDIAIPFKGNKTCEVRRKTGKFIFDSYQEACKNTIVEVPVHWRHPTFYGKDGQLISLYMLQKNVHEYEPELIR